MDRLPWDPEEMPLQLDGRKALGYLKCCSILIMSQVIGQNI